MRVGSSLTIIKSKSAATLQHFTGEQKKLSGIDILIDPSERGFQEGLQQLNVPDLHLYTVNTVNLYSAAVGTVVQTLLVLYPWCFFCTTVMNVPV